VKLYYRVIAIKIERYWHKNTYEDQWSRIKDPCSYVHLFLTKFPNTYNGEKKDFSTTISRKTGYLTAEN
jgi:hypothetical protein